MPVLIMAIAGILLLFNPDADPMTKEQKVMQGTYLGFHIIDWRQTRYAAEHPDEYGETNILMGRHPSTEEVDAYMAASALLHTGITKSLPTKYRKAWQMFTIGFEIGVVHQNAQIGVKVDF